MRTALVAIAKNEGPYIREWTLYHKMACGFDEVIVYDNDSTDDTRKELERMSSEGLCSWRDWPRARHDPPQQTAYADALAHMASAEWMCLLDIDEFLVLHSHETIGEFVSMFPDDTGSISFNWAVFYSLEKSRGTAPVTKRVGLCYGDPHVKTIARVEASKGCGIHTFDLKPGFRSMHCSGREYKLEPSDLPLDAKVCTVKSNQILSWEAGQVNHYMMKSEEEVLEKDERGRATSKGYAKKNIMEWYKRIAASTRHTENESLSEYLEARCGADEFYEACRAR